MISREVLHEDGGLLDQGRIGVLISEARSWRGKRGIGKSDPRQTSNLLRARPQEICGDLAVVAQLEVDRQGLLGEPAQRLAIGPDRGLDPVAALLGAAGQAEAQLAFLGRGSSWSVGLHRLDIVAVKLERIFQRLLHGGFPRAKA